MLREHILPIRSVKQSNCSLRSVN